MRLYIVLPMLAATLGAADTARVTLPIGSATAGVWHISGASADVPRDASSPKLTSAPQLSQRKKATAGSVSVSFSINEQGFPIDIQIDKSSNKELDDEVTAMIREWRFKAAIMDGAPVSSRAYLDLSLGDPAPVPVGLAQSDTRKYYILGLVNRSGEVDLLEPTRVSMALANAGGFKDFAKTSKIRIIRAAPGGKTLVFNYNDREVRRGENLGQNILLEPGDRIYVD